MFSTISKAYLISEVAFKFWSTLPNDNILDWPKLEAFADNNLNVAKIMISLYDSVENIVREGENAGYQHFLVFPQCFQQASSSGSLKAEIVS